AGAPHSRYCGQTTPGHRCPVCRAVDRGTVSGRDWRETAAAGPARSASAAPCCRCRSTPGAQRHPAPILLSNAAPPPHRALCDCADIILKPSGMYSKRRHKYWRNNCRQCSRPHRARGSKVNILHLDSSPSASHSATRHLSQLMVEHLLGLRPSAQVTRRDLAASALPHFTGALYEYVRSQGMDERPAADDPTLADLVMAEFMAADIVVIGAPMY